LAVSGLGSRRPYGDWRNRLARPTCSGMRLVLEPSTRTDMSKLPYIVTFILFALYGTLAVVLVEDSKPQVLSIQAPSGSAPSGHTPRTRTHSVISTPKAPAPHASHRELTHHGKPVLELELNVPSVTQAAQGNPDLIASLGEKLRNAPPATFPLLMLFITWFMVNALSRCFRPVERPEPRRWRNRRSHGSHSFRGRVQPLRSRDGRISVLQSSSFRDYDVRDAELQAGRVG